MICFKALNETILIRVFNMKGLSKGVKIFLAILAVIVAVILFVFVIPLVTESPPAVLMVHSGKVELAQSPFRDVTGTTQISVGNSVKTYPGSEASIVFFGSSILRLGENTTLTLSELDIRKEGKRVSLKQDTGRVWNKVIKLSGIEEYSLETPDAVATIRGTAFDSWVRDNLTGILVAENRVNVTEKTSAKLTEVNENEQADVSAGTLFVHPFVEDSWIKENKEKDEQFLLELREKIKSKYWIYLLIAKSQYKLTDEQVNRYIDNALRGTYSQDQVDSALNQLGFEIKV